MAAVSLSYAEKVFILHGIEDNIRNDGRTRIEYRSFELETGTVSNATGSAKVKLSNTVVLVGVKAELGVPSLTRPHEGRLEFFVDCSANAAPQFEGRGGDDLANDISSVLSQAYQDCSTLDLKRLCVADRQHCWILYIDVLLLECGGSLYDAVSIAVKAALFDTKIPNLQLITTEEGKVDIELSDDPYDYYELDIENCPILITCGRIAKYHVVDMTPEEEACVLCQLIVGVTQAGHVTCCKKTGSGSLLAENTIDMTRIGREVGMALNKELLSKLTHEKILSDTQHKGFLR